MMKSFFSRVIKVFKDPPPPYRDNEDDDDIDQPNANTDSPTYEILDLLAHCKADNTADSESIKEMGLWHSTPLARRHKSKISLTWVLKENLENSNPKTESIYRDKSDCDRRYVNERYRKCRQRVVGRNEQYLAKFRSAEPVSAVSVSDSSDECSRRRHRHRHRRKKKPRERFGYDIKDLDSFLTEASIDRPGNIPVVVAYPTALHQTQADCPRRVGLPLGTVVNAVFKQDHWLYAQTPHGAEGYVQYAACMPLPIQPPRQSAQKKTPCWESSTDIYPRPCGNLTDTEKEQLRGRSRSECRYQRRRATCAEKDFDNLYLKTKSVSSIAKDVNSSNPRKFDKTKRQTLLVVTSDYAAQGGSSVSVKKGEVVVLERGETDVDAWFYVRKKDGGRGYIPAKVAGNGYI